MSRFSVLIFAFMLAAAQPAAAQLSPDPPPPMDEYNNVPPGLLMVTDETPPPPAPTDESNVMTMDDILARYKEGKYDTVIKHLMPIAKGDYPLAQELLGIMYRNGQGVEKDPAKAIEWLTKAAGHGRPVAEHHLGTMAFSGEGAPADTVRALMFLHIALAHYADGPEKEQAKQDRDNLMGQMSRRDRERAYSLARDWLEKRNEESLLESQGGR